MQIDKNEQLLFKCNCHGHIFEVFYDKDDDQQVWFQYSTETASLWQAIKWWWKDGRCWSGDVILDKKDLIDMRDAFNKYII